jgi:hypothetical protein
MNTRPELGQKPASESVRPQSLYFESTKNLKAIKTILYELTDTR